MSSSLYEILDISGWNVLITGASSGFGEACAWRFAELKCSLILIARRFQKLQELKQKLEEKYSVNVYILEMDVQDIKRAENLPNELPEEYKKVDILINNAGLALGTEPIHEVNMQDIRTMFQTNVLSVFAITKAFVPGMIQQERGHIVNMSSVAGRESYAGGSGYCGSKFAIDAMTTAARHDLIATPIRVTSISPGAAKTEFSIVRFGGDVQKADSIYEGFVPLNANDIADNVVYAVTRPAHVQIADILVFATAQSSAKGLSRQKK